MKKPISKQLCVLFFSLSLGFYACDNDDDALTNNPDLPEACSNLLTDEGSFLVLNEGGFQASNASLSTLSDLTSSGITNDVFATVNTGKTLGDVAQSVTFHDGNAYIVVNNSGKIEVVCQHGYYNIATIEGLSSPRYMAVVNEDKAYVSNYYSQSISIVDLESFAVSGQINYPIAGTGFGERNQIEVVGTTAYVADADTLGLVQINTQTDAVQGVIALSVAPRDMVKDAQGNLWVFGFNYDANFAITEARVYKINTSNNTISGQWAVEQAVGYASSYLQINEAGNELYCLFDEVYQSPINDFNLSLIGNIPDGVFAYGFGVSGEEVFVCDPIDYSQEGKVLKIDATGNVLAEFEVGVVPSKVYDLK